MKTNDKNSKKRAAPPRYDEAFRAGAVRMVTEQGRPSKEVAQELGIAPLPELMDRKKRDIMERKGDKEDENKRQKQQKESSAAAL